MKHTEWTGKLTINTNADIITTTLKNTSSIISFDIHKDNCGFTIVRRYPSHLQYMTNPPQPAPDKLEKQEYRIDCTGKLFLSSTKYGNMTPITVVQECEVWDK